MSDDGWTESSEGELDWDLTEEAGDGEWEPPPHRRLGPLVLRIGLWLMLIAMFGSVLAIVLQTARHRFEPDPTPTPVFFTRAPEGAQGEPVLFFARPAPDARVDA